MAEPTPIFKTTRRIFAGRRAGAIMSTGVPARRWEYVDEDDPTVVSMTEKPLVPGNQVGDVIEMRWADADHYWSAGQNGPRIVDHIADHPSMTVWQARDRADDEWIRNSSRARTMRKDDAVAKAIEPLIEMTAGMNASQRRAFAHYVYAQLVSA